MSWKVVLAAVNDQLEILDFSRSPWALFIAAIIAVAVGFAYSTMHGVSIFEDGDSYVKASVKVAFVLAFLFALISFFRVVCSCVVPSESELTNAYEDEQAHRFVRKYAAAELGVRATARGASGWAEIWQGRADHL
ncbi:hypothetical protein [Sedimentitalea nanhaiensis]|uniref:Uncharacterized protein n=1 Tax=Sedimentitalea nanhaiensis TaxID=999627 RepID=A0A1I7AZY9_9RHOB|nr:hypothetical protein [Sedimentitalea nanhaiensis]SFT80493.1 hypothetical protein SAMN05216236_10851 [Sedimentitalea nanhaiensis]